MNIFNRFAAEWRLKLFLGGAITILFWVGYFFCERYPLQRATLMAPSAIDRMLPFVPSAAIIYVSQFATLPLLTWLLASRREVLASSISIIAASAGSFLCFALWPTAITRPSSSGHSSSIYDAIVQLDGVGNACPSLHAAFAVLVVVLAHHVFADSPVRRLILGLAWLLSTAVIVSALLIKQHVLSDMIAGSALGGAAAWLFFRLKEPAK